jgi:hypothetical protein
MSMYFATCDLTNLVTNADGTLSCTAWEMREVLFPMYELSAFDLATVIAATTGFLLVCYGGRTLLRMIYQAANHNPSD